MDVVFQADLVAGVGGDSLRTSALDADRVGFREISSHGEQANLAGHSLGGSRSPVCGRVTGRRLTHEVPFT